MLVKVELNNYEYSIFNINFTISWSHPAFQLLLLLILFFCYMFTKFISYSSNVFLALSFLKNKHTMWLVPLKCPHGKIICVICSIHNIFSNHTI